MTSAEVYAGNKQIHKNKLHHKISRICYKLILRLFLHLFYGHFPA